MTRRPKGPGQCGTSLHADGGLARPSPTHKFPMPFRMDAYYPRLSPTRSKRPPEARSVLCPSVMSRVWTQLGRGGTDQQETAIFTTQLRRPLRNTFYNWPRDDASFWNRQPGDSQIPLVRDSLAQRPEPADCPADRALIHLQPAIECIAFNVAREPHRLDPIRAEGRRRRHDAGRLHPRTRVSQAPWLKCRISCLAKGERAGTASAAMS